MHTLELHVDGQAPDSLSACVWSVLSHWGQPLSYECVAGLSGAAFSPALRRSESCAAWWMEAGCESRLEFLGHALGFSVERSPDLRQPGARRRFGCVVRQALLAGDGVLCASWPCWTLLTEWHDDAAGMRVLPPAGLPRPLGAIEAARMYILRPAERYLTRCEALRDALRFASQIANGRREGEGVAYGGELYAAWQARLQREQFCPDCGTKDWRCAERTARRARDGQSAAARFLGRAGALLPSLAGNQALADAEEAYATMAEKLTPYAFSEEIGDRWQDRQMRARYAEDVGEVGGLHLQAARSLAFLACTL
jgi:hypothetical protein